MREVTQCVDNRTAPGSSSFILEFEIASTNQPTNYGSIEDD